MRNPHELITQANIASREVEQEDRLRQALRLVQSISAIAGTDLAVMPYETTFRGEPGIYLENYDERIGSHGRITDTRFALEKKRLSGAADSAHAVLAGDLFVGYEDGELDVIEIAAKCFQKRSRADRFVRTARELSVMRTMAYLGELTLEPVALAVAPPSIGDMATVVLTRFNSNLYTLDSKPWGRGLKPENMQDAQLAAQALGKFNHFGFRHNDAKIKNVATIIGNGIGMIDYETTEHFDPDNPQEAGGAAHKDLGLLIASLQKKGLFNPATGDVQKALSMICGEEGYLLHWQSSSNEVQSAILNSVIAVVEQAMDVSLTRAQ